LFADLNNSSRAQVPHLLYSLLHSVALPFQEITEMKTVLSVLAGLLLSSWSLADPLPFEQFMHLHRDMSEAELLQAAGKPDYVRADPSANGDRQLFWLGDADLPYTTLVILHNGLVSDIRRDKRL
jgi:hypothetical protein